jgi:hypothetical protein
MFVSDLPRRGRHAQFLRQCEAAGVRHAFGLPFSIFSGNGTPEQELRLARRALAAETCAWLDCWKNKNAGSVSDFALCWIDDQRRWNLQIDYHGLLFPAIALQLALVLADADSLYTCSGCGIPYIRPRERKRPKSGWANYCDQCVTDGVAGRRAAETYREKRAEAVRLRSGGASVHEIAKQLNAEPGRVQKWVGKGGKDAKTKARK